MRETIKNGSGKNRNTINPSRRSNLYVIERNKTGEQPALAAPRKRSPGYLKLFVAVLGLYLLFSFMVGGYQVWQLKKQIQALENEQKGLLDQQQELVNEIESLNNPEIIERIARESLGMVKQGETIIVPATPDQSIPERKILNDQDIAH